MFNIFKTKKTKELYAPVTGKMIDLENVSDPVFSKKMMGDGVAFELENNIICAPCDGKIEMIANTLHAIGMHADNGAEILIHIGLDTVNLAGKGFRQLVQKGDKVTKGTPMIEIDMKYMKEQNIVLTTPMIITNSTDYNLEIVNEEIHVVMGENKIITFK